MCFKEQYHKNLSSEAGMYEININETLDLQNSGHFWLFSASLLISLDRFLIKGWVKLAASRLSQRNGMQRDLFCWKGLMVVF